MTKQELPTKLPMECKMRDEAGSMQDHFQCITENGFTIYSGFSKQEWLAERYRLLNSAAKVTRQLKDEAQEGQYRLVQVSESDDCKCVALIVSDPYGRDILLAEIDGEYYNLDDLFLVGECVPPAITDF